MRRARDAATHCYYCDTRFAEIPPREKDKPIKQIDHFIPSFLGGNNKNYNKAVVCFRCNGLKDRNSPQQFLNIIEATLNKKRGKRRLWSILKTKRPVVIRK